jgi:hypothetical protein
MADISATRENRVPARPAPSAGIRTKRGRSRVGGSVRKGHEGVGTGGPGRTARRPGARFCGRPPPPGAGSVRVPGTKPIRNGISTGPRTVGTKVRGPAAAGSEHEARLPGRRRKPLRRPIDGRRPPWTPGPGRCSEEHEGGVTGRDRDLPGRWFPPLCLYIRIERPRMGHLFAIRGEIGRSDALRSAFRGGAGAGRPRVGGGRPSFQILPSPGPTAMEEGLHRPGSRVRGRYSVKTSPCQDSPGEAGMRHRLQRLANVVARSA